MAPSVPAKGNQALAQRPSEPNADFVGKPSHPMANTPMPPEVAKAFGALVKAQAAALKTSEWVGKKFADEARSMHYGEKEEAPIHGQATRDEAEALVEEGIAVAPLLVPVAPPEELN